MKPKLCLAALILVTMAESALADASAEQTLVFVRHGEKPATGLGQLNCQGLNRALALPRYFSARFGKPDAIFAPNPSQQKKDQGVAYNYVRPLVTIEPTAIAFGMPVHVNIGFDDVTGLIHQLGRAQWRNSLVLIAWEHKKIDKIARKLLRQNGGDPTQVPIWSNDDFDSVYVVKIRRTDAAAPTATFERTAQGLNQLPTTCPAS